MNEFVFNLQRFSNGNDNMSVSVNNAYIYAGSGNDSVYNDGYDDVTIAAGSGNDTIYTNNSSRILITGGTGNDTVFCRSNYSTISGGSGNDSISNITYNSSINGGSGNDYIYNYSYNSTIAGGAGDDTISLYSSANGNIIQFADGDDNDIIYGWTSGNSLSLASDAYYTRETVGSNVVVNLLSGDAITLNSASNKTINIIGGIYTVSGKNFTNYRNSDSVSVVYGTGYTDTLYNHANRVTILGYAGNDTIVNYGMAPSVTSASATYGRYASIMAGDGNDSVDNSGRDTTVDGGNGNDTIANTNYGLNSKIAGGNGNDLLTTYNADYVSIDGGADNDRIELRGTASGLTAKGGTGNDTIYGSSLGGGIVYQFTAGDGSDVIYNFKATDTISLGGDTYTRSTVGSNVVISLVSGGAMTLNGAKGKTINITNGIYTIPPISNSASNTLITGNANNNQIINSGNYVTINALGGNDTVYTNNSSRISISGGEGNDSIYCRSNYSTVNGDAGADTISNITYYSSISGGSGNDSIFNNSVYSTINGGTGNDKISFGTGTIVSGNIVQFAAGDGYDTIYNWNSSNRISLQSGAYYTRETLDSGNVLISLLSGGSMTLVNASNKTVSVTGGIYTIPSGINTVISSANGTFYGTSYNDTISNSGTNNKIFAGSGNDSIYNNATNVTIGTGAGNDSVIIGYTDSSSIDTGYDDDFIQGHNNRTTITAGAGNDTVTGNHYATKIVGGDGNDSINITYYWYNTLDGGAGNDTIYAEGGGHSVNGGAGADLISLSGSALTVTGGKGNDTIYGDTATSHLYQYTYGDGNDIIYNWSSNDTLTIGGGVNFSSKTKGKNVLVSIAGGGQITLSGAKGKTVNINGKTNSVVDDEITPQDVIKRFMLSLDNATISNITTMLDNAVKYASNNKFTTIQKAIDSMVSDCASYAGDWKSFLKDKCNIDLDNDDTGAISGYDAGGSNYEKTKNSVIQETGNVNKNFTGNYFNVNGLNVYLARTSGNTVQTINYNDNSLNDKERYIWQGLKDWWLPGALNLIEESYGSNFGFSSNSTSTIQDNKLYVTFYNDSSDGVLASVGVLNNTSKNTWRDSNGDIIGQLQLSINMNYYDSVIEDNEDGKMEDWDDFYLDRVLAHEFTHAVMDANIRYATGSNGLPQFIKDGMSELTHGIDDDRKSDIKSYASDSSTLNKALDVTKLYQHYPAYAGGYMFLRYLAKQASNTETDSSYSDKTISKLNLLPKGLTRDDDLLTASTKFKKGEIDLSDYSDTITKVDATALKTSLEIMGNAANNSIKSGKGSDKLYGGAGNDTLYGGASDDVLYGGSDNDKLYGEAGNDTLRGGTGKNSLKGGAGKDVFVYEGGKDYIADFTTGEDKIQFLSGSVQSTSFKKKNLILKTEDGAITIKGGKGKQITVIDADGLETTTIYGGAALNLTNSSKSKVTLSSAYANASAAKRTKAIQITGNELANSIVGGTKNDILYGVAGADTLAGGDGNDKLYGQAGNDSLWGGAGDDSLWGGDGNDTFLYKPGTGNDVILDYTDGDMLQLLDGKFSKSKYSNGTLALTIKGGGSVTFENVTTATTFNINDKLYEVSGSKLSRK